MSIRIWKRLFGYLSFAFVLICALSACAQPTPIVQVVEITATPQPPIIITATREPTATATQTLIPTLTPTVTLTPTPLPATTFLQPMNHQYQTQNNCGPASVAIVLGYFDIWMTQAEVNQEGLSQFPHPCLVRNYIVENYDLEVRLFRYSAYAEIGKEIPIQRLLAEGIPVIVYQELSSEDDIIHYRVMRGYNEYRTEVISADPMYGPMYNISYADFGNFYTGLSGRDRIFLPVYRPEQDDLVERLMAELGNDVVEITSCAP
ncbi:MAG: C39 family peptidase [Anaerolineales bacterium]|nr:C39 family peptidase [Anaerolineales bacterium]